MSGWVSSRPEFETARSIEAGRVASRRRPRSVMAGRRHANRDRIPRLSMQPGRVPRNLLESSIGTSGQFSFRALVSRVHPTENVNPKTRARKASTRPFHPPIGKGTNSADFSACRLSSLGSIVGGETKPSDVKPCMQSGCNRELGSFWQNSHHRQGIVLYLVVWPRARGRRPLLLQCPAPERPKIGFVLHKYARTRRR